MTKRNAATKETTPFVFYKSNVVEALGVPVAAVAPYAARIGRAFDMGEPVWMVADEIALRLEFASIRRTKTPRELAARVVQIVHTAIGA